MRILGRRWLFRASTLGAGAATALFVLSACGYSAPASTTPSTSVAASGASGSAAVISTASGADGTYLVGPSGKAVYLWMADTSSTSTCSGACAAAWPPVTTNGAPTASGSATAKDLGMTKRSDGTEQVTYDDHPLYYYAGDGAAGQTNGQGNNGFGALWWLVDPSGSAITKAASNGGGAAPSSSGAYGGY
ncbi:MAG: hypothetical protein BGO26_13220 [Actinobacteria bacterium 69-20]|nr:MAG: hypothetical protein BGO26_13220 [Actinobacteria bacterium 69-20]